LAQAKTPCEILANKISNEGASVLALTNAQRTDASEAFEILNGQTTLVEAARLWARHNGIEKGVSVADLGQRWLKALRVQGCRETTMRERGHKVDRLCSDMGDRNAASMTTADFVEWMDAYDLTGATRDGYRRCYRAMFEYGVQENLIPVNPCARIPRVRSDEVLPEPFTVDAVQAIMANAEEYAPVMVPPLAVQFFAGLRPGEAKGMTWQHIDLAEGLIRVTPEVSKVRRSRLVEMSPTVKAWLAAYAKKAGPIGITTQNQFDYYMKRKTCGEEKAKGIIAAAGVDWIQDGPRKTFATMHFASNQDAGALAAILGHTGGVDVLYRHYRGLATKKQAAKYWKIKPKQEGNVIQMRKAAG
jgi:integrase